MWIYLACWVGFLVVGLGFLAFSYYLGEHLLAGVFRKVGLICFVVGGISFVVGIITLF